MRVALLSAVVAMAFSAPAWAQAPSRVTNVGTNAQNYAFAERCKLFQDGRRTILKALRDESFAEVQAMEPAQLAAAQTARAEGERAAAAEICTGPQSAKRVAALSGAVSQATNLMVLRSAALLAAEAGQPYAYELTSLRPHRTFIRLRTAALQAGSNPAEFQKTYAGYIQQMPVVLALVCAERKKVRWSKGDRPCPVIPAASQAQIPYARALVESAEFFAAAYFPKPSSTGQLGGRLQPMATGGPRCMIEKTLGTAKLTGSTGPNGVYGFTVETEIPATAVKSSDQPITMPLRLKLMGQRELAEVDGFSRLQSVQVSGPKPKQNSTTIKDASLTLSGKQIAATVTTLFGINIDAFNIPNNEVVLYGISDLAQKPQVSFSAGSLLSGEATLPDLAQMLKTMDHASLLTAYQQCWP